MNVETSVMVLVLVSVAALALRWLSARHVRNPRRPIMPADPIVVSQRVQLRRKVALNLQRLFPDTGCCGMCQIPAVNDHHTPIDDGRAVFPLCEECWQELGTPENRLPYYRALFDSWNQTEPQSEIKWADIEAAVKKEGNA